MQIFSRSKFSFSSNIFIFFLFANFLFSIFSLRLSHLLWNFQRRSRSNKYLNHNQWIFSQCRSIEEMNSRFATKFEEKKKIMLRTCFENIVAKLKKKHVLKFWHSQILHKAFRFSSVHICFLDQIFSFLLSIDSDTILDKWKFFDDFVDTLIDDKYVNYIDYIIFKIHATLQFLHQIFVTENVVKCEKIHNDDFYFIHIKFQFFHRNFQANLSTQSSLTHTFLSI